MTTRSIEGTTALGGRLAQWQDGGDAIHQVASYFVGGHPVTLDAARAALTLLKRHQKAQEVRVREDEGFVTRGMRGAKKLLADDRKSLAHATTTIRQLQAVIARAERRADKATAVLSRATLPPIAYGNPRTRGRKIASKVAARDRPWRDVLAERGDQFTLTDGTVVTIHGDAETDRGDAQFSFNIPRAVWDKGEDRVMKQLERLMGPLDGVRVDLRSDPWRAFVWAGSGVSRLVVA